MTCHALELTLLVLLHLLNGLVYVTGGIHRKPWRYCEQPWVYNVEENMWEFLPPMNYDVLFYPFAVGCTDGRFYVVPRKMDNIIQLYDPHDHA